jgi:hypothetical protein
MTRSLLHQRGILMELTFKTTASAITEACTDGLVVGLKVRQIYATSSDYAMAHRAGRCNRYEHAHNYTLRPIVRLHRCVRTPLFY